MGPGESPLGDKGCEGAQSWWTKQRVKSLGLHNTRGSEKQWGWLWRERNVLGAASASCHTWGDCETPAVPDGKSFLQRGGDFQVTSTRMSYSSRIVRRAWRALASGWAWQQWLGGRRGFRTSLVVPALLHLGLVTRVLLLDGQDALALLDQLHAAVGDEPDGQGAHGET